MTRTNVDGLLVLDKPGGMTSRDVVNRAQKWFPRRTRVGHTGTLDPLATGVLVLCVGQATRLAEYVQAMIKTYRTVIRLGQRSSTGDADGEIQTVAVNQTPDEGAVRKALTRFIGEINQVPPAFSAAKVTGQRAYDLARAGREVALQPRRVRIYEIDVERFCYPRAELKIRCGKGTYIRSLARDLGECLGCGAFIEALQRTAVGQFTLEEAVGLDVPAAEALAHMQPLEAAVSELWHQTLADPEIDRLRHGMAVPTVEAAGSLADGQSIAIFDAERRLVAVARWDEAAQVLRPGKVLAVRSSRC